MKRFVLSLFVLLLFVFPSQAAVKLAEKNRIPNRSDDVNGFAYGYCAWSCLETLGRHNGITTLHNLVEWRQTQWPEVVELTDDEGNTYLVRRNYGDDLAVRRCLEGLKVKFTQQLTGNKDIGIVTKAVANGQGCTVGMKKGAFEKLAEAHAVVVLDLNADTVVIFDPNDPSKDYKFSRSWFDKYWCGWAVVIPKKAK